MPSHTAGSDVSKGSAPSLQIAATARRDTSSSSIWAGWSRAPPTITTRGSPAMKRRIISSRPGWIPARRSDASRMGRKRVMGSGCSMTASPSDASCIRMAPRS